MAKTWVSIADWCTAMVRDGSEMHECTRDVMLSVLRPVLTGAHVLDAGHGDGLVTRAVAARGATRVSDSPAQSFDESDAEVAKTAQRLEITAIRRRGELVGGCAIGGTRLCVGQSRGWPGTRN